jgi:hypothetical protein
MVWISYPERKTKCLFRDSEEALRAIAAFSSFRTHWGSDGIGTMMYTSGMRIIWLPRLHRAGPSTSLDKEILIE